MNKLNFYLSIVFASILMLPSCSDVTEKLPTENEATELAEKTIDSEPEQKIKTVVTTDDNGNQLVTKIETKADGTEVKTTTLATADEIREIAETGELMAEDIKSSLPPPPGTSTAEILPLEEEETYDFHAYEKLNTFLGKYVSYGGNVNYSSINSNKALLEEITREFESNFPGTGWSSAQKLTYWINAYNVYTIKLIVDNYPTSSITNITAKPWHKKFIKLNGSAYSLNQIENDIVRKQFNEPRIHFALNCGSISCPVLLNKAYTPGTVYSKMTSQTKRFLNDASKNTYGEKEVQISQIFDWYGEDFTKGGKTVFDFINKYRTDQLDKQKVTYQEYSWDLNK
jgi:hypothetical protein